jgi:hypothetical protein
MSIFKDIILESFCSCPYDWGPTCKHEVAVMYAIRDEVAEKTTSSKKAKPQTKSKAKREQDLVKQIIKKMPAKELRNALAYLTKSNREAYAYILSSYGSYGTANPKKTYQKLVKSLVKSAQGKYGFIEYNKASKLGDEVSKVLLSFKGKPRERIQLCEVIIDELAKAFLHADDSSGYMGYAMEAAFEALADLVEEAGNNHPQIISSVYDLALKEHRKSHYDGFDWGGNFRELAVAATRSKEQASVLLKSLDTFIEGKKTEKYGEYAIGHTTHLQWELLDKWFDKEEADSFLQQHLHMPKMREIALEKALSKARYGEVKKLAEDGIKLDTEKKFPGLVSKWKSWLMKLAEVTGNNDVFIKLKEEAFLERGEMRYFHEIKQLLPKSAFEQKVESWIAHFDKTDSRFGGNYFKYSIADIYEAEHRREDLLTLLETYPDLHHLDRYTKILTKKYPNELASLYNGAIRVYMESHANGRKDYKKCCNYLNKIVQLGGIDDAKKTVQLWRAQFPRRKAMLEELGKLRWLTN